MHQIKSRQLRLYKLLVNEQEYQSTHYFSTQLCVSTKTIYNDVKTLNEQLASFSLKINTKPRLGIKLEGALENKNHFSSSWVNNQLDQQKIYTPENRRMSIMKRLVLEGKPLSLTELEQEYFVTVASLRADLDVLQKELRPLQVSISTTKTIIAINGSERAIQKAYRQLIMEDLKKKSEGNETEFYRYIEELFQPVFVKITTAGIKHLLETTEREISDYYIRSLYLVILIFLARIALGYHISKYDAWTGDYGEMEPYLLAVELIDVLENSSDYQFEETDIHYLSSQLFAHNIEPITKTINLSKKYENVVNEMIRKMSDLLEVDLTKDTKLRESLLSHIPSMIYRIKRNIEVNNPLLEEIKKQYIILFSLIWYVSSDLETQNNIRLNDHEISFLFIHFQVSLEKRHGISFKNILIVCPLGLATSELVFNRVRQILPNRDNIITLTEKELYSTDIRSIDFVITTVELRKFLPTTVPVIKVSPLVTNDDLANIMCAYSAMNQQVNKLKVLDSRGEASIKQYIQLDSIFCKLHFETKKECLDFLISYYEQQGWVTKEFRPSVLEREIMGDTSLYTGIAIPHALPDTVKVSNIAIATLKEKIPWGAHAVNAVFVVGMANKDLNNIREVLAKLMMLVESEEFIKEMTECLTQEELTYLLNEML